MQEPGSWWGGAALFWPSRHLDYWLVTQNNVHEHGANVFCWAIDGFSALNFCRRVASAGDVLFGCGNAALPRLMIHLLWHSSRALSISIQVTATVVI